MSGQGLRRLLPRCGAVSRDPVDMQRSSINYSNQSNCVDRCNHERQISHCADTCGLIGYHRLIGWPTCECGTLHFCHLLDSVTTKRP